VGVTDEAIEQIKRMIVSGELGPGDRLPREADLAERLGLSRNSLREAVRALTLVRILDARQGDGTYVTTLEPDVLLDALSFVIDLHQDRSVLHLLEVRRILEAATAALAAREIDAAGLAELERLLDEAAGCETIEELVENDLAFHRTIGAASGNPVLASLLDGLSSRTNRARIWRGITQGGVIERTRAEHRAVYEAIAAGRPELAEAAMTVHVGGVEAWLRQAVEPGHDAAGTPSE
jgi:GntR family transcriptional regulator, transcriptional repressor for pyruvate dehydrogenase complex